MRLLLILFASAALLAACKGDDPASFEDLAPLAAEEALIAGDDLPPGWREEPGSTLSQVELTDRCDVLTPEGAFPDAGATSSSPSFATVDRHSVQTFSAVFESGDLAAAAIEDLEATVDVCRDEFLDAVRDVAKDEISAQGLDLGPFADIDVAIEHAPLAGVGEEATVYEVGVNVSVFSVKREFNADLAIVREGRVVGVLLYSAYSEIQGAQEAEFLERLLARLDAAELTLP